MGYDVLWFAWRASAHDYRFDSWSLLIFKKRVACTNEAPKEEPFEEAMERYVRRDTPIAAE